MFSQYKMLMLSLEVEIIFNFVSIPKIMEDDAPFWASLVAQMVKNLPAMQETLGQEDPLEKETATHSSILAWRIPRTEEPGGYSPWDRRAGRDAATNTFTFTAAPLQEKVSIAVVSPCAQSFGETGTEMELKQTSSAKAVINLFVQNFILFLLLYLSVLKTEEYQGEGGA